MTISFSLQDQIAIIEFDDGNRNVVNHGVLEALESAWARAQTDAKAIVLKGRVGSFCAGYDLAVMTGTDRDASAQLGHRGGKLAQQIYGSPIPVVGLTQGHAFTIGLLWLAGCDVRIGEQGPFKFGMTEVALNVPLTGWALAPLRARLHAAHLTPALLHSTIYSPQGALDAGFIDQLVPSGDGLQLAIDTATRLAELPAHGYRQTKLALRQPVLDSMAAELGT